MMLWASSPSHAKAWGGKITKLLVQQHSQEPSQKRWPLVCQHWLTGKSYHTYNNIIKSIIKCSKLGLDRKYVAIIKVLYLFLFSFIFWPRVSLCVVLVLLCSVDQAGLLVGDLAASAGSKGMNHHCPAQRYFQKVWECLIIQCYQ